MSESSGAIVFRNDQEHQDAIDFTLELARALQAYGIPSHRLEENMALLNKSLGIQGQFFSSPGTLMASFDREQEQRTFILRAASGDVNLEKLDCLVALTAKVAGGVLSPAQGSEEVARIVHVGDRYGPVLASLCFLVSSGGAARLFGGGWREILVAALIGMGLGLLVIGAGRFQSWGRVLAPVAAIGARIFADTATLWLGPYSVQIATVTGLIVLIPGLSLTVAMTELATGHPVSGTGRLANAMVLFLMIGFGIALGSQVGLLLPQEVITAAPEPLPDWTQWVALILVPLSFAVLFKAKPGEVGWVFLAGVSSFSAARLGSLLLGPELGGFLGALALGVGSNVFARISSRPGAIILVPGIMLLVPGSIGFRGISSLLARDTLLGVETFFAMALAAMSLVAGLLFANVIFARKRPI